MRSAGKGATSRKAMLPGRADAGVAKLVSNRRVRPHVKYKVHKDSSRAALSLVVSSQLKSLGQKERY